MTYILPQVQVFQDFRQIPTGAQLRNAFVFGPHYGVFRDMALGAYDPDNDTIYDYPSKPADSVIDVPFFDLYLTDLLARYAQLPASTTNPLVVVSNVARNKLRAAPRINQSQKADADGVIMQNGGFFTGGVDLPEKYYFYPIGGWVTDHWDADGYIADLDAGDEEAKLAFITTEDLAGSVDVLAVDHPLTAGNTIQGPNGIVFDFDTGARTTWTAPRTLKFADAAGTSYFTLTPKLGSDIKDAIDALIDVPGTLFTAVATVGAAGSVAVTFTPATLVLEIDTINNTTDTLAAVRAAIVGALHVTDYFTVSAIGGLGVSTNMVDSVKDETGADISGDTIVMLPDAYRVLVQDNEYVFATANGIPNSSQFKTRGVKVNDRVYYTVTVGATTYTGMTKVTGFEADYTLEMVNPPTFGSANALDNSGTNLTGGVEMIEAGTDNQRTFAHTSTKLFAMSPSIYCYPGEYNMGVLSENMVITVTATGVAGDALVSVRSVNGTYARDNVPTFEGATADDVKIYIGRNMYVNLHKAAGDLNAELQTGDTYTFSTNVITPFAAVDAGVIEVGGIYTGSADTTYVIEVARGGVFNRSVTALDGIQVPVVAAVLHPYMDWEALGDVDDEYVLSCTQAGTITEAEFGLESQRGDNVLSGIKFVGLGTTEADAIDIGSQGLSVYFSSSGAPAFTVGDFWIIRVAGARPQLKITDSAGIDQSSYITLEDNTAPVELGLLGATITFIDNTNLSGGFTTGGGLVKGDLFYVLAEASEAAAVKTLVLADDLPDAVVTGLTIADDGEEVTNYEPSRCAATLYLVQAKTTITNKKLQTPPDFNWVVGADNFTVYEAIAVQDASWVNLDGSMPYLPVYSGDISIRYRALLNDYTDTLYSIADVNDIVTQLGEISVDNPLAQGVYNALLNSGSRSVFFMGVVSDNLAGYATVLDRAALNDIVYALNPLTTDLTILDAVKAHVLAMSQPDTKKWRVAFVGTELPVEQVIYNRSTNPEEIEYLGTVSDDPGVVGNQYTILLLTNGSPQALNDVHAGDKVYLNFATDAWGSATYDTFEVASVLANNKIKLKTGPSAPIVVPAKVEVWHPNSVAQIASAIAARSLHFSASRVMHVGPGEAYNGSTLIPAQFNASIVAGLCSSVPPQQGLTNIEITGLTDIPLAYRTFTRDQLNEMAAAGTLLLMQEIPGSRIYVRHQLTTAAAQNNLNTAELSMVKNLDSISYYFADLLAPYIGRYNITPGLLGLLAVTIRSGLNYLQSYTSVGLLGPQIIQEGTSIQTLEQHPVLKDHVYCVILVNLPAPFNVIELHLVV